MKMALLMRELRCLLPVALYTTNKIEMNDRGGRLHHHRNIKSRNHRRVSRLLLAVIW